MPLTAADLLIACLVEEGVRVVFGVPGEETTELMAALQTRDIEFVLCRHEQAAAFMASVHGRLTGEPAVCLATLGPGATNLVTGVADATQDFAPLIALTGQAARARLGRESHQVLDLERLFAPVTKHSRIILDAGEVPGAVSEAVRVAKEPRPGAVHLSLPEDVASTEVDARPLPPASLPRRLAAEEDLRAVLEAISEAKRPVLLAGGAIHRGRAGAAFGSFVEKAGCPAVTSFFGKGLLPWDHAQHAGVIGLPEETTADRLLLEADLILAVGFDPIELEPRAFTKGGEVPVAVLSSVPLPRDAGWRITAEAVGDIAEMLERLSALMPAGRAPAQGEGFPPARPRRRGPSDPETLLWAVQDTLQREDIVLSGVGNHKLWVARGLAPRHPGQLIIANGLAGMGMAVPGALAAARLQRHGRVLSICGDGDALMNLQELETATRNDLQVTLMVWVDGGYGLIERKQADDTTTEVPLSFSALDWKAVARGFGFEHHAPTTSDGIRTALEETRHGRHIITCEVVYPET